MSDIRIVSVPGALRWTFRNFLETAPADLRRDVLAIWDELQWRGRPRGESANISVDREQANYLMRELGRFISTDGTMLARPAARKLRDRLSVGWGR